jgi:thiamine biosynthesis lipoprotein
MTADAYATAFMVMGVEKGKEYLKKHPKLEVYFIYTSLDGKLKTFYTRGFEKLLRKNE